MHCFICSYLTNHVINTFKVPARLSIESQYIIEQEFSGPIRGFLWARGGEKIDSCLTYEFSPSLVNGTHENILSSLVSTSWKINLSICLMHTICQPQTYFSQGKLPHCNYFFPPPNSVFQKYTKPIREIPRRSHKLNEFGSRRPFSKRYF